MIIVLGVAGSGKSTQSKLLANACDFEWVSIGELLRNSITDSRRDQMLQGKLLDENEVIEILDNKIESLEPGINFVLDGFPRTKNQADWLIENNKMPNRQISAVLHLKANEEVAKNRLLNRARQDDHESAIAERFFEYENTIKPIIKEFRAVDIQVLEFNAERQPEVVFSDIINKLKELGVVND